METRIDLSGVFAVVGKPDEMVAIDFSYTNPLLLNAYIDYATNELAISSAGSDVGECVFTLTGTYGNATISTTFRVTILATGVKDLSPE